MHNIQFLTWLPKEVPGTNGILKFYPLFIMLGIMAAFTGSWIKLKRREIPTEPLEWSIFFIIPSAILGASIIGKINSHLATVYGFWSYFMFWEGGLSVHGGVIAGIIVGFFWFRHYSKKYEISLWVFADAIIPNILLGQIIGRWGNFFNHELLGTTMGQWLQDILPNWFLDNLRVPENTGLVHHPLFLYESLLNLILWVVITFTIPKVGMWFSVKPWKKHPEKFIPIWKKELNFLKTENKFLFPFKKMHYHRLWKLNCWNQDFFLKMPVKNKVLVQTKNYSIKTLKARSPFFRRSERWLKIKWVNFKTLMSQNATDLEKSANPDRYRVTRVGVQTGCYVIGYNVVRMILEPFRNSSKDILFPNDWLSTYIFFTLGILIGVIIIIFAQFICVWKWRQVRWLYEKQY